MSKRHIPWIIYAEGRDIYEFYFTVPHEPGGLFNVLKSFKDYNINLLSVSASAPPEAERVPIFVFADLTNVEIDLEEFKRIIERESGGRVVIKRSIVKGFMLDEIGFPLTALPGVRSIIFLEKDIDEMIKGLYDKLGELASVFIYHMAYSGGRSIGEYISQKLYPVVGGGSGIITEAIKIYQSTGWARVELAEYDPERIVVIRLYDSFECDAFKGSARPMSSFIRGHINGLISGILGKELSIKETRCIARGDEYCEFILEPR